MIIIISAQSCEIHFKILCGFIFFIMIYLQHKIDCAYLKLLNVQAGFDEIIQNLLSPALDFSCETAYAI